MNRHRRKLRDHCGESLSYSAYLSHRRLYYNLSEDKWTKVQSMEEAAGPLVATIDTDEISAVGFDIDDANNEVNIEVSESESESEHDVSDCSIENAAIIEDDVSDDNEFNINSLENEVSPEGEADESFKSEVTGIALMIVSFLMKFHVVYKISDTAIVILLRFFKYLVMTIGRLFNLPILKQVNIPISIQGCSSFIGCRQNPFKEYVVCPTCHMLYDPQKHKLVEGTGLNKKSAYCNYIKFPHHTQAKFRSPCNTLLMNTVKRRGRLEFKAWKTYCYYGFKVALEYCLKRPAFLSMCNSWEQRLQKGNMMSDIIDGKVWLEEIKKMGNSYNVLGFLINIDWFQPFKDVSYSVGIIYAVIINLPRNIRYKDENVIIIGVIPGPKEPSHDINSYLGPMVIELLELYSGVWFATPQGRQFLRGILICVSSDIPATRKTAGFVGIKGNKGCSRCLKTFPIDSNNCTDYSGYNRENWPQRSNEKHREYAYKELKAKTKAEKKEIDHKYGARYSVLLELPYYNCIRFVVVDVMHNLFLGTSKHVLNVWKELNILDSKKFIEIQAKIQEVNVPQDIGRIPLKIESGMAGMTADQWKNWTCVYSLYALQDILPKQHVDCWWLFVQACLLLYQPTISVQDIQRGDQYLLEFCKTFQQLYGPSHCTPNMHLHCHIAECLYDYGPAHATWCFSFERCNGILGSMPNNNKPLEVEKTMLKQFVRQLKHSDYISPTQPDLQSFFPETSIGSLYQTTNISCDALLTRPVSCSEIAFNNNIIDAIGPITEHALDDKLVGFLKKMYETIFESSDVLHVGCLCRRFTRVRVAGTLYSSRKARTDRNSFICAYWLGDDDTSINTATLCRPGCVQYYIKHNVVVRKGMEESSLVMNLAFITWYEEHPEKHYFLHPNTLWSPESTPTSEASFIPISRIACRCMQGELDMTFHDRPYNSGKAVIINPVSCVNLLF